MDILHISICHVNYQWDKLLVTHNCVLSDVDEKTFDYPDSAKEGKIKVKSYKDYSRYTCNNPITNATLLIEAQSHPEGDIRVKNANITFKNSFKVYMDGYIVSVFVNILKSSVYYRRNVMARMRCKHLSVNKSSDNPMQIVIQLKNPQKDVIDYAWNERMVTLALERRELDNAMSWLSTLGGAFSALGDICESSAEVAGRISIQQMSLALRLGDPMTVVRCRLYLALSLLQRGYLRQAKNIIREQYKIVCKSHVIDMRIVRMCQGIWAKLKYSYSMRRNMQICSS